MIAGILMGLEFFIRTELFEYANKKIREFESNSRIKTNFAKGYMDKFGPKGDGVQAAKRALINQKDNIKMFWKLYKYPSIFKLLLSGLGTIGSITWALIKYYFKIYPMYLLSKIRVVFVSRLDQMIIRIHKISPKGIIGVIAIATFLLGNIFQLIA